MAQIAAAQLKDTLDTFSKELMYRRGGTSTIVEIKKRVDDFDKAYRKLIQYNDVDLGYDGSLNSLTGEKTIKHSKIYWKPNYSYNSPLFFATTDKIKKALDDYVAALNATLEVLNGIYDAAGIINENISVINDALGDKPATEPPTEYWLAHAYAQKAKEEQAKREQQKKKEAVDLFNQRMQEMGLDPRPSTQPTTTADGYSPEYLYWLEQQQKLEEQGRQENPEGGLMYKEKSPFEKTYVEKVSEGNYFTLAPAAIAAATRERRKKAEQNTEAKTEYWMAHAYAEKAREEQEKSKERQKAEQNTEAKTEAMTEAKKKKTPSTSAPTNPISTSPPPTVPSTVITTPPTEGPQIGEPISTPPVTVPPTEGTTLPNTQPPISGTTPPTGAPITTVPPTSGTTLPNTQPPISGTTPPISGTTPPTGGYQPPVETNPDSEYVSIPNTGITNKSDNKISPKLMGLIGASLVGLGTGVAMKSKKDKEEKNEDEKKETNE